MPTWCPFRLQIYCNGHSYLARQLSEHQIEYRVLDNGFGWIADFERAQKLADHFSVERVHRKLDEFAQGKLSRNAIAEGMINNVRKTIIRDQLTDPRFYAEMSKLLDHLIKQSRADAAAYEAFLKMPPCR